MKRAVEFTVEVLLDEESPQELKIQENVIRELLQEAVPEADVKLTGRRNLEDEDEEEQEDDYDNPAATD